MLHLTDIIILGKEGEHVAPDTDVSEEVAHPFDEDDDISFDTPFARNPEDIGHVFDFNEGKFSIN